MFFYRSEGVIYLLDVYFRAGIALIGVGNPSYINCYINRTIVLFVSAKILFPLDASLRVSDDRKLDKSSSCARAALCHGGLNNAPVVRDIG